MNTDPYWWRAAAPDSSSTKQLPIEVDALVVGSGYTGLAAALTLARASRDVLVVDRARIGEGASTRNAGMLSGNLKPTLASLTRRLGGAQARAIYQEAAAARSFLHALIEDEGIKCDCVPAGRYTPATNPKEYEALARQADELGRTLNVPTYAVPRAQQSNEIGSDSFFGGVVNEEVWSFHPGLFHQGLLKRTRLAGARVHGMTEVTKISQGEHRLLVETNQGFIAARNVVVATNGYTTPALAWWQNRVIPIRGRVVSTAPIGNNLMRELIPKGRVVVEGNRLFHYFRPSPDGTRLLAGGRYGGSQARPERGLNRIRQRLKTVFPEIGDIELEHDWHGYTAFTRDLLPHIGEREGVHYAMGFCGSGTVWGTWLGTKVALKILGHADAATAFDRSLPGIPGYRGKPWFLAPVMGWFAFRDAIDRASSRF